MPIKKSSLKNLVQARLSQKAIETLIDSRLPDGYKVFRAFSGVIKISRSSVKKSEKWAEDQINWYSNGLIFFRSALADDPARTDLKIREAGNESTQWPDNEKDILAILNKVIIPALLKYVPIKDYTGPSKSDFNKRLVEFDKQVEGHFDIIRDLALETFGTTIDDEQILKFVASAKKNLLDSINKLRP